MKIKFIEKHIVRGTSRDDDVIYEEGQVADFGKDPVDNSYARAYIERGHAVEYDEVASKAAQRAAKAAEDDKAKADADAKAKADAEAKAKAEADAKAKQQQGGSQQQ